MSTELFQLKEKLASLESAILERHPRMPTLLQEIHRALRDQPENVILLSTEEINTIVSGLMVQHSVSFAPTKTAKAKTSSTASIKARLAGLSADDL